MKQKVEQQQIPPTGAEIAGAIERWREAHERAEAAWDAAQRRREELVELLRRAGLTGFVL